MTLKVLEPSCEWTADDMKDPATWTERLTATELDELDRALDHARSRTADMLDLGKADFPLPTLGPRLQHIARELLDGRGFVLLRGLPRHRYDNDAMCLAYWGIGAHLGRPWPQNHHGHLLGDVTDHGKSVEDETSRFNELGQIGLDYHCDGSDLVGLMCLQTAASGGSSTIANSVSLHNALVRQRPELAAELYKPQPIDLRGQEPPGWSGWFLAPVFSSWGERLFVRLAGYYTLSSQRHSDAPRLTDNAREALVWLQNEADSSRHSVVMDFEPGDMQFINNYHVLHGRTPYVDDCASGMVRHLKRLWLEAHVLTHRPPHLENRRGYWDTKRAVSRLDAV